MGRARPGQPDDDDRPLDRHLVDLGVAPQEVRDPQAVGGVADGVAEQDSRASPTASGSSSISDSHRPSRSRKSSGPKSSSPVAADGPLQHGVDGEVGVLRLAVGQGGALEVVEHGLGQVVDADLVVIGVSSPGHRRAQSARYPPSTASTDPVV